eukprot:Phypoly_transcript_17551.p1 GENE.Phypoly_transcript_17551~~Phypoly_transcript_17551.p1  ORF type:complete len:106 (+),score=17.92 Phypoly_transcript_17551:29-319(+)
MAVVVTPELAVRELMVTAKICKSMMDLAQRNINFGQITKYDYRTKTLVINNLSEVPLIYRIKKSGSIASLDLNISNVDKSGVVRFSLILVIFIFFY